MDLFVWNMAISFQVLFLIISGVIFIYIREKSFKYYALYIIFLLTYLLSRNDYFYYAFENFIARFLTQNNAEIFTYIACLFLQIVFYNYYCRFALHFLDLDKHIRKYFNRIMRIVRNLGGFFFGWAIIAYYFKTPDLYIKLFTFVYIPIMLSIFVITFYHAIQHSAKHKNFFLVGVCAFVFFALVSFTGSQISSLQMENPIKYFFIGIIIETLFFSLGLAYKVKLINDDKNRILMQVTKHRHRQQISKLNGVLEGEEKERKRIAEELHDGVAGDLTAIKYNLLALNSEEMKPKNSAIIKEITEIIDNSCLQIRELSHNLSPSSITQFGLVKTIENLCLKSEKLYGIRFKFVFTGEQLQISKVVETHIYRIIQELINNIIRHSGAKEAFIDINYEHPELKISVRDNGIGFRPQEISKGIGLNNIDSRIRFLNANFKKIEIEKGSWFIVDISLDKIVDL